MKTLTRSLLLAALLLIAALGVHAQDDAPFSETLDQQMDGLVTITENLRGLETITPVERDFPTREETIAYLTELYSRELPPEEVERTMAFYVALDLLPPDLDYSQVFLDLLGSQVAGFYDPDTQVMNVIPLNGDAVASSGFSLLEQIIFIHEYVHALQDQHFGLNALMDYEIGEIQPDMQLARIGLVEGDATAIMQLYTSEVSARNPLAALSLLMDSARAGNLTIPPGVPQSLVDELLFPYEAGMSFVLELYDQGGWEAINAAYANPPTTTEHILHPETYIDGELPQEVTLPDYAPILGDDWSQAWDITLGEYYLRAYLKTQLSLAEASSAAAGWGGDHFEVWTHPDGLWASALRLRWDTLADQAEFGEAFNAWAESRFGFPSSGGCWVLDGETALDGMALCVQASENDGTLIVRAPTEEIAAALLEG